MIFLQIWILCLPVIIFSKNQSSNTLIFVQTIWRHGDRSPTAYLRNLSVSKNSWVFGGGGYGELTTIGMNEHFELGKKMKQRYIDHNYLSKYYDSKEVFIRSTDKNRTLISAMSNMLGMFSSTGRTGIDIPDNPNWPKGYMPVPIHAPSEYSDDCLLNSMCKCKRTNELLELARNGKQFKTYINRPEHIEVCEKLSKLTGVKISWKNLYLIQDVILASSLNFPNYTNPLSDDFYEKYHREFVAASNFFIGLFDPEVINGINIRVEVLKLRAGLLMNEIVNRMKLKSECIKNQQKCNEFIKNIKYYAYSSHDHTIYSLLSILRIENIIPDNKWPDYSADLTFELYLDSNSKPVFKIFYLKNPIDNEFEDVTNQIKQCKKVEYCDLQVLLEIANEYQPGENGCENEGRGKTRRHLFSGVGRINGFLWILVVLYGFYMFI